MNTYDDYSNDDIKISDWMRLLAPRVLALSVVTGILSRIIMVFASPEKIDTGFFRWMSIFGLGILNDLCLAVISLAPAVLVYIFLDDTKYKKGAAWFIMLVLATATAYSFYPGNYFSVYSSWVLDFVRLFTAVPFVSFCMKFFIPQIRKPLRALTLTAIEFCYVLGFTANVICECLFWHKFRVRYNFIAVDRLLYSDDSLWITMQSYPIIPIVITFVLIAIFITWKMFRKYNVGDSGNMGFKNMTATVVLYLVLFFGAMTWLDFGYRKISYSSSAANQLQRNGIWNLMEASRDGNIEYYKFYPMLPTIQAEQIRDGLLAQEEAGNAAETSIQKNIILITLESVDYSCLDKGLCPFLDSLSRRSISFSNMFACGSSMSKGIDALTLCTPPCPGMSISRRFHTRSTWNPLEKKHSNTEGLPSVGKRLQADGYATAFIYGGNGRRANLRRYYSDNGYEIIEKKDFKKISFENSMGACDDDTYREAVDYADRRAKLGKPFHAQIMSLSSHSPYSFPGRGLLSYNGRNEAVEYTDAALARFFDAASKKPWFSNTVFVITSGRGSKNSTVSGPLAKEFHIPAMIYAPGFIQPEKVGTLCSQIDLMPTLLSLLQINPDNHFYGRNILSSSFIPRAFVSNYQQLGYMKDSTLTVLQPMREVITFKFENGEQIQYEELDSTLPKEAQAFYQSAAAIAAR